MNEHEAGKLVRFGLEHPTVRGINFQPAFHAGWFGDHDPLQRVTIPDVLRWIEAQTEGLFTVQDFVWSPETGGPDTGRELPEELQTLLGWVACLGDARPVEEYVDYLLDAGFICPLVEPHDVVSTSRLGNRAAGRRVQAVGSGSFRGLTLKLRS